MKQKQIHMGNSLIEEYQNCKIKEHTQFTSKIMSIIDYAMRKIDNKFSLFDST